MSQLLTPSPSYIAFSQLYLNGCDIAWASNTTLTVASGIARDSTNVYDMQNKNTITVSTAFSGVNGLDTGTVAANTWYAVYLIYDTSRQLPAATVLSTSASQPRMPSASNVTYSAFRRVGWVRTDGSSNLLNFVQAGTQTSRFYQWDASRSVLAGGSATTFTAVNLSAGAPAQQNEVALTLQYTPSAAANTTSLRPTGSAVAAASSPVLLKSSTAAQLIIPSVRIIPRVTGGNASIDYVVTASDSLTILVTGFADNL